MREKTIKNLFKYSIKWLFILTPLIFLFICYSNINKTYYPNIEYHYETNEVNSFSDLVSGNIYHLEFDLGDGIQYSSAQFPVIEYFNLVYDETNPYNATSTTSTTYNYSVPGFRFVNSSNTPGRTTFAIYYNKVSNNTSYALNYAFGHVSVDFVWKGDSNLTSLPSNVIACISSSDYNVIDNVQMLGLRAEIINFFEAFVHLPINTWYLSLLSTLGITFSLTNVLGVVCFMPLWILYVYLFDLALDFLLFIPKLADRWLTKLYGGD